MLFESQKWCSYIVHRENLICIAPKGHDKAHQFVDVNSPEARAIKTDIIIERFSI